MFIVLICFLFDGVIIFPTNLSFLIKLFLYVIKKAEQKCKYLKVDPRVEKTGVFKKSLTFCKWDLFYEFHNEKTLFSIMDERNSVFSLFLPRNYFLQH